MSPTVNPIQTRSVNHRETIEIDLHTNRLSIQSINSQFFKM